VLLPLIDFVAFFQRSTDDLLWQFTPLFETLSKIAGTPEHCGDCEACVEMCPMNIRVRDYIVNGERVLSTECTLCQTCIHICPHESLRLSFGLDVGGKEYIDYQPPRNRRNPLT
jgi:ferredoxin-type protein NapH